MNIYLLNLVFPKMMYNISIAEKRVLCKEKQFLEVLKYSMHETTRSCPYIVPAPHYLCSDLPSIWFRGLCKPGPDIDIGNYQSFGFENASKIQCHKLLGKEGRNPKYVFSHTPTLYQPSSGLWFIVNSRLLFPKIGKTLF